MEETVDIVLNLKKYTVDDSAFVDRNCRWEAKTLIEASKDLPVFELPLAGIDLSIMPWKVGNILSAAEHMKRVLNASLKYPIILDDFGYVCDGWHRIVKSILLNRTHIRSKRLIYMPTPDEVFEEQKS